MEMSDGVEKAGSNGSKAKPWRGCDGMVWERECDAVCQAREMRSGQQAEPGWVGNILAFNYKF